MICKIKYQKIMILILIILMVFTFKEVRVNGYNDDEVYLYTTTETTTFENDRSVHTKDQNLYFKFQDTIQREDKVTIRMTYGGIYDCIIESSWDYIDRSLKVWNGEWSFSKAEGISERSETLNNVPSTIDPEHQFLIFSWQEYPFWNDQGGENYRTWNESIHDSDRYSYFKGNQGDEFDDLQFSLAVPYFADNKSLLINELLNQWNGLVFEEVDKLPSFTWNPSKEPWNLFKEKLFWNVAYNATVLGLGDSIIFEPAWIGDFWYPNSFEKWNGTDWVDRVPPDGENYAYGSDTSPFNESSKQLSSIYSYYARTTLNTPRKSINSLIEFYGEEVVNYQTDKSEFDLSFEVLYKLRDKERVFYHSAIDWENGNYHIGSIYVRYRFKYEFIDDFRPSHTLKLFESRWEFHKGTAILLIETTTRLGQSETTPGFTIPIVIQTGIISSAIILWTKRRKIRREKKSI